MIAVGDIKVLLSKVLTRQEMEDILENAGMKDAVGLSRQRAARARALFSHDLPVEHLGENIQYRLG